MKLINSWQKYPKEKRAIILNQLNSLILRRNQDKLGIIHIEVYSECVRPWSLKLIVPIKHIMSLMSVISGEEVCVYSITGISVNILASP